MWFQLYLKMWWLRVVFAAQVSQEACLPGKALYVLAGHGVQVSDTMWYPLSQTR